LDGIINNLTEIQFSIILAKNQLTGNAAVTSNEIYSMQELNILGTTNLVGYTYDNAFFKVFNDFHFN